MIFFRFYSGHLAPYCCWTRRVALCRSVLENLLSNESIVEWETSKLSLGSILLFLLSEDKLEFETIAKLESVCETCTHYLLMLCHEVREWMGGKSRISEGFLHSLYSFTIIPFMGVVAPTTELNWINELACMRVLEMTHLFHFVHSSPTLSFRTSWKWIPKSKSVKVGQFPIVTQSLRTTKKSGEHPKYCVVCTLSFVHFGID